MVDDVTRAAMYLLAKNQGIPTRNKKRVEKEWARWHPCVHASYRKQVRRVIRALAWAR